MRIFYSRFKTHIVTRKLVFKDSFRDFDATVFIFLIFQDINILAEDQMQHALPLSLAVCEERASLGDVYI